MLPPLGCSCLWGEARQHLLNRQDEGGGRVQFPGRALSCHCGVWAKPQGPWQLSGPRLTSARAKRPLGGWLEHKGLSPPTAGAA